MRQVFEQLGVGKAPVNDHLQVAWVLRILLRIELVTKILHPLESEVVNIGCR